MSGLIGRKIGMTSIFDADGKNIPVTVLEAGPCVVTQIKSKERDGYEAIQLAYEDKKEKHTTKALQGHFKKAGVTPKKKLMEFTRFEVGHTKKFGDSVTVGEFQVGEFVDISSYAKGKGFQGVVKRYNFSGTAEATHGTGDTLRAPGSIGASSDPSRVFKGMRMAGRMGGQKVKTLNLKVMQVFPQENIIVVKGAVSGPNGSLVKIERWS